MPNLRELSNMFAWHSGRARWMLIHIPKNAGVSFRRADPLRGRLIQADPYFHRSRDYTAAVLRDMNERGEHHGFQHARWRDLHPGVTARLPAVAVIRNPFARTVSRWRFGMRAMETGASPPGYVAETFEGFLEERHIYGHLHHYWHRAVRGWYPQVDYVTDAEGRLRADLLRLEHLADDVPAYFGPAVTVSRRNASGGKTPWRDWYTPDTIRIVADWYAADIDFFGFDFDTPATRNVWAGSGRAAKP